jgi:ribosomal protein L28
LSLEMSPKPIWEIGQTFKANIKNIQFLLYHESPIKSRLSAKCLQISLQSFQSCTFSKTTQIRVD